MTAFLDAKFVYTQSNNESVMVGFADDQFNTTEYILLQRMLDPLQEGNNSQQEDVYIEINEQKYGVYGGVRSIVLSADLVVISLGTATASKLHLEEDIEVSISTAALDFEELREALELLCSDVVEFKLAGNC